MRSIEALTPPRWTLEWCLPQWLSQRLRLDADLTRALTLSNILGLVAIRLEDDLRDGEVAADDAAGAARVAAALFDEALAVYREWLDPDSPFWSFVNQSMTTWRAGADGSDAASRASPIKIGPFAMCLLADDTALWPRLDRCLDHAMRALVAYDQFCDWEADLEAVRWNAFVAGLSSRPQGLADRDRNRAAVLTAMLTGDAVGAHFGTIAREAELAATLAFDIGLSPLQDYMVDWAAKTAAQGADVARHYHGAADRATQLIFNSAIGGKG